MADPEEESSETQSLEFKPSVLRAMKMCHAIVAAWYEFDGPAGFLGKSRGSIHAVSPYDDTKKEQDFERGCIHYDTIWESTRVYFRENNGRLVRVKAPLSEIMHEYYRLGGEPILGVPSTSDERQLPTASYREFKTANGTATAIFLRSDLHPAVVARVDGLTWTCWMQRGGIESTLGLPKATAEAATLGGRQGRMTLFDGGGIFEESGTSFLKLFARRASDGVLEPLNETNEPLWRGQRSGQ